MRQQTDSKHCLKIYFIVFNYDLCIICIYLNIKSAREPDLVVELPEVLWVKCWRGSIKGQVMQDWN